MKKWKIVLSAVLAGVAAVACGTAIGCKKSHSHEFASEWTTTSTEHWHEATCGDTDEKGSYGTHTFDSDYHCTTCGYDLKLVGLSVTKTTTDYELKNRLTRNVPIQDIEVKGIAEDESEIELNSSAYELEFYEGSKKIPDLTSVGGGSYNIWAKANIGGEECDGFVVVYVVETVTKFESNDGFTTTQELGSDKMSGTWTFTVTYSSGREKIVNFDDEHIQVDNYSTFVEEENKKAVVTYTETDCKGTTTSMSQDVLYTITKGENNNVHFSKFSYTAIQGTLADSAKDNQQLTNDNLTGDNSFLTLTGSGMSQYRSSGNAIEIKGDNVLSVTLEGEGMLVIGCRSTGGANISSLVVKGPDGECVAASYNTSSKNIKKDDDDYIYAIAGESNTLTFMINTPGTYTVGTVLEVLYAGDYLDTDRYLRILDVQLTDVRTDATAEGN